MVQLTPTPGYSLAVRVQIPNQIGMLAKLMQAISAAGGDLGEISLIQQTPHLVVRDITIDASSTEHDEQIVNAIKEVPEVQLLSVYDRTFNLHKGGKITVENRIPLKAQDDLAMAYTPGVGRVSSAIAEDLELAYKYTIKSNIVAIVSDGTAVLGLGDLGPEAAMPVMEGKAMLFKTFAGVDAFPICLATKDTDAIVQTVKYLTPVFGGINLEDISAPRCFEIEERLRKEIDIPVFHDDQHGTAIVTLAALINALKIVKKSISDVRIVFNGAGASGIAVARLLRTAGAKNIWMCDSKSILSTSRTDLTPQKKEFAVEQSGTLADAMKDADVFVGLSVAGAVKPEMVRSMAKDPIVFAMANPVPEIQPELIVDDVAIMATGRSDYPNQINNVLAFPGVFRGALDCRARSITTKMCLEASYAIASLVNAADLDKEHIIPSVFDERVSSVVSAAVQKAAREDGVARA
ncbi:NAD-dependent malic enzyme [Kamptonema formosum]|uniref:NAD-dependent malic enzyme n=1 Tax=Kamptonema formosum TaxID=331992 RepID=UPI000365B6B6|nr:NAD-dependent malic enzyme [Oscillatoria sp. PCC 10802]